LAIYEPIKRLQTLEHYRLYHTKQVVISLIIIHIPLLEYNKSVQIIVDELLKKLKVDHT